MVIIVSCFCWFGFFFFFFRWKDRPKSVEQCNTAKLNQPRHNMAVHMHRQTTREPVVNRNDRYCYYYYYYKMHQVYVAQDVPWLFC